jgi:hypothetical protein
MNRRIAKKVSKKMAQEAKNKAVQNAEIPEAATDTEVVENEALDECFEQAGIEASSAQPVENETANKETVQAAKVTTPLKSEIDADHARLNDLMNNPLYKVSCDEKGHFCIAESKNGMKIWAYGEGGQSDLTSSIYVYAASSDESDVGMPHTIKPSNVRKGGNALADFMMRFGGEFEQGEINVAFDRLWVLVMVGELAKEKADDQMNAKQILNHFLDKIDYEFNGINTMNVYCEEFEEKGRIDIGVWDDVFDAWYAEIEEQAGVGKHAWLKHAKKLKWLLPDKGRGGGQHNPGVERSARYDRTANDRIQRFNIPMEQAREWMDKRYIQNMVK